MTRTVSLTEAKAKLNELVRDAQTDNVVLVRHGQPAAVIVSPEHYEALLEEIEDLKDRLALHNSDPSDVNIPLEALRSELGVVDGTHRLQSIADVLERTWTDSIPELTANWERTLAPSLAAMQINTPASEILSTISGTLLEWILTCLRAFLRHLETDIIPTISEQGRDLVWIDVVKRGQGWIAESSGEILTREETKEAAVRYTAQLARSSPETISVRIHKTNGQLQEERTYPPQRRSPQSNKRNLTPDNRACSDPSLPIQKDRNESTT